MGRPEAGNKQTNERTGRRPGQQRANGRTDRRPGTNARNMQIFADVYRFVGLSWETSTFKNYHPEDSERPGSGRIEFSSKSITFFM